MYQLILAAHIIVSVMIIILVLLQHGKGADIGAAFGSGASNTLFGSRGTGGFMFKSTGILAAIFFLTSLTLSALVARQYQKTQTIVPSAPSTQVPSPNNSLPVPEDKRS